MKILIIVGMLSFLVFSISSYFVVLNMNGGEEIHSVDLNGNFDRMVEELEDYGGAMIVKYDLETGEILSKRRVEIEAKGLMTVTEEEAKINKNNLPINSIIVSSDISPLQAIEEREKW